MPATAVLAISTLAVQAAEPSTGIRNVVLVQAVIKLIEQAAKGAE